MSPFKFAIKCGNFAVLVDLHVLPLGRQEDASWFTAENTEEVTALVRDAVDKRVRQYAEFLHVRAPAKQKKELPPATMLCLEGKSFNLVANFLKRHCNLRCLVKQRYGELRVFPERYIVCVSCLQDAFAHHGNPSLAATDLSEQSRSEYFSRAGETQEPSNSPGKTKSSALQKSAKQAGMQPCSALAVGKQRVPQRACLADQTDDDVVRRGSESKRGEHVRLSEAAQRVDPLPGPSAVDEPDIQVKRVHPPEQTEVALAGDGPPGEADLRGGLDVATRESSRSSKRCKPTAAAGDPQPRGAKRACLGAPTHHVGGSTSPTPSCEHLPPPPLPAPPAQARARARARAEPGSKAFPVSECSGETTVEVELLTPGKRAQRLPLTSNNTEQTNQNRLPASLRGLSVKPASTGSSIGSRSALREEGSENVPRAARLRRLKKVLRARDGLQSSSLTPRR